MTARPPRLSPEGRSEAELLAGLQRADREAFETLYETYFPRIYRYFRHRLGTVAEAERATEAALTEVFEAIVLGQSQLPLGRFVLGKARAASARGLKSRSLAKVVPASTHSRAARS